MNTQEKEEVLTELRNTIDEGLAQNKDVAKLQELLGLQYLLQKGYIKFSLEHTENYLMDLFMRNIAPAEDFIRVAIAADFHHVQGVLSLIPTSKNEDKKKELLDLIDSFARDKEIQLNISREEIALHYLDNDEEKFVFNIENTREYIDHFLLGINLVEHWIIFSVQQDSSYFEAYLNSIKDTKHAEKLITLILTAKDQIPDKKFLTSIQFKNELLLSETPNQIASVLEQAYQAGFKEVVGDPNQLNAFLLKVLNSSAFDHIKNYKFLSEVYRDVSNVKYKLAITGLYNAAIKADSQVDTKLLCDSLKEIKQNKMQVATLPRWHQNSENEARLTVSNISIPPKLMEDITHDYYIASISQDVSAMLDLAINKNPRMFIELLNYELLTIGELSLSLVLKRENFYRQLLSQNGFNGLHKRILTSVNDLFEKAGREPIIDFEKDEDEKKAPKKSGIASFLSLFLSGLTEPPKVEAKEMKTFKESDSTHKEPDDDNEYNLQ